MAISLLTIFIVSYFLHIPARIPILGNIRFDMIIALLMLIAVILARYEDKFRMSTDITKKLSIFFLYVVFSIPLVTWPGSVIRLNLFEWVKPVLLFIFIIGIVRTEKQLKWIMYIFLSCQTFRILEPLYLHQTTGYWGDIAYSHVGGAMTSLHRLSGSPYDIVNSNQLAWIVVTVIPFYFYCFWQGNKRQKILFITMLPLFIYCLIMTGSRSGMISLFAVLVGIIYLSKKRIMYSIISLILLVPLSIYLVSNMRTDLKIRYESIIISDVPGADTAKGRIDALKRQLSSITHNPLFGNGVGTSGETNVNILGEKPQITHSLYIEILQETGIIGLILFALFIYTIIKGLVDAKNILVRMGKDQRYWLYRLITGITVWIFMDLIYSLSCFGLRSWEWYFFGGVSTVCIAIAKECKLCEEKFSNRYEGWSNA